MALSAMGVQIAPLIAGAGVVGVAVGFGAQTLVKDVISGIFYLLDDAFRVGEYIISGSYKGTVESFSLRSIKLRHHRGYLYTVPFGSLGAVQNMSRDWVIDKLQLTVPYDTDLDLLKKIVKQIGKELAADPELAPDIIQPLKMQGVEAMGEIGMQVRLKMMTKPGEQFIVRRRAYAMLKKALAENGIRIATPTVQVSDGDARRPRRRSALRPGRRADGGRGRLSSRQRGRPARSPRIRAAYPSSRASAVTGPAWSVPTPGARAQRERAGAHVGSGWPGRHRGRPRPPSRASRGSWRATSGWSLGDLGAGDVGRVADD